MCRTFQDIFAVDGSSVTPTGKTFTFTPIHGTYETNLCRTRTGQRFVHALEEKGGLKHALFHRNPKSAAKLFDLVVLEDGDPISRLGRIFNVPHKTHADIPIHRE